jgi:SWI/SNF-related matrix-associated actin-dependent regulator 1 of chromatin subfamily A
MLPKMDLDDKIFKVIIADECHYIKNSESKRSAAIVPLIQRAKRAILLSGTLTPSRPAELYPQITAVGRPIFPTMKKFGDRYCSPFMGPYGMDYTGHSNLVELHKILENSVMIRRLKKDVLTELPAKIRNQIPIVLSMEELKEMKSSISKISKEEVEDGQSRAPKELGGESIMEMWKAVGRVKTPHVVAHVVKILKERDDKMIIFGHHLEVLDGIEHALKENVGKFTFLFTNSRNLGISALTVLQKLQKDKIS